MRLPRPAAIVPARDPRSPSRARGGIAPACTAGQDNIIGECAVTEKDGVTVGMIPNQNCTACCARRNALFWRHLATGNFVAC